MDINMPRPIHIVIIRVLGAAILATAFAAAVVYALMTGHVGSPI